MAKQTKASVPYEVMARKYRPQTFADVVGQSHVTETLTNAINTGRIAHAYLFVGPRGTGKTSTARIFAKALNCEKGPTPTPCNTCDICREITEGRSLDVLEIDGASNNGVEQVRELRENVRFMPARGKFKIYVIDEVHMLSTPAFNALLKTLEEPPPHVKFVFATTEVHKLPATILSRCQRFDLRRISTREIIKRLRYIIEQEAISADDSALLAIARGAEGGMRDAQSALDQLVSFQGKHITESDVLSVFGLVSHEAITGLSEALLKGDIPAVIARVDEFDQAGKDLQRVLFDLLDHLRNVLIFSYTQSENQLNELAEVQVEGVKTQAAGIEPGRLTRMLDVLIDTEGKLRYALSRRTMMEMGLIRAAGVAVHVSIEEIMAKLEALQGTVADTAVSEASAPPKKKALNKPEAPVDAEKLPVRTGPPSRGGSGREEGGTGTPDLRAGEERPAPPPEPRNEPAAAPPSSPAEKPVKSGARRSLQDWTQDPGIRKVLEVFNGDITDVKE